MSATVEVQSCMPQQTLRRTRMRTPVVRRQTLPESGCCPSCFRCGYAKRRPSLATCSVFLSVCGCIQRDCTKPFLRVCRHRDGSDRACWHGSLRPRNCSVPSYRPPQRRGDTSLCAREAQVRERGSTRHPLPTIAVYQGARQVPHQPRGLREKRLCPVSRSMTQGLCNFPGR